MFLSKTSHSNFQITTSNTEEHCVNMEIKIFKIVTVFAILFLMTEGRQNSQIGEVNKLEVSHF